MAISVPRLPWTSRVRVHLKAICQAIPFSFLIVAEGRDMYYRATWVVSDVAPSEFRTGDIVAVCNRWYTLPTWSHALYSLLSKVLLKSSWDDVCVVWVRDGVPHLCFCDMGGAKCLSVDAFVRSRAPRGMALRRLVVVDSGGRAPTDPQPRGALSPAVAALFFAEAQKLSPRPWALFAASMRCGQEHKYYEFAVEMCKQRRKINEMCARGSSAQALAAQREKLKDMEVMREHLATFVEDNGPFRLFNGSLAASFLATFDLLDRTLPPPSRYVPQDFAHDLPFKCAAQLEEPVVFFKN